MYEYMNSVSTVFHMNDLRSYILKCRKQSMRAEYIKKIYPTWKYSELLKDYYIFGKPGNSSEKGTAYVRWSLCRSSKNVDHGRLVITDYSINNDANSVKRFDGIVDHFHVLLREQRWFLSRDELYELSINGEYEKLKIYSDTLQSFENSYIIYRNRIMNKEFCRRNRTLKSCVYMIVDV